MDTKTPALLIDEKAETQLLWHKPEVKRLSVSFDTASGAGSNTDGFFGSERTPS